jgi:hypothetical protein
MAIELFFEWLNDYLIEQRTLVFTIEEFNCLELKPEELYLLLDELLLFLSLLSVPWLPAIYYIVAFLVNS